MTAAGTTVVVRTRARRRVRPAAAREPAPVVRDRVPRVARVLALAHHWQGLIRTGVVRDQAGLARLVGVSRARVTQVMGLLYLAPDIQEAVLNWRQDERVCELDLRPVTTLMAWSAQRVVWRRMHARSR